MISSTLGSPPHPAKPGLVLDGVSESSQVIDKDFTTVGLLVGMFEVPHEEEACNYGTATTTVTLESAKAEAEHRRLPGLTS